MARPRIRRLNFYDAKYQKSVVVIGDAGYSEPQDNTFLNLFAVPFRKQRDYWRPPGGKQPERSLLHGCQNILAP
jgi:hypothetical protein